MYLYLTQWNTKCIKECVALRDGKSIPMNKATCTRNERVIGRGIQYIAIPVIKQKKSPRWRPTMEEETKKGGHDM